MQVSVDFVIAGSLRGWKVCVRLRLLRDIHGDPPGGVCLVTALLADHVITDRGSINVAVLLCGV